MKSLYLAVILMCAVAGLASSCETEPPVLPPSLADEILGEWVYDSPQEGRWESMKFLPTGVFFYSDSDIAWRINEKDKSGRYSVNEENSSLLCAYFINGVSNNLTLSVHEINEYSFTARFNDTGLQFTYAKLLSKYQIKPNESVAPDYSALVKAKITGYTSHKPKIASVDASTGAVTGVSSGRTYIDVITEEGTAVIEIIVFDENDLFDDYTDALGKTIPDVIELYGKDYIYRDDNVGIRYLPDNYVVDTVTFYLGVDGQSVVDNITMSVNDNVTSAQVYNCLKNKYDEISIDKENTYLFIIPDKLVGNAPVTVIYYPNDNIVFYSYVKADDLWRDFIYLFQKSHEEVKGEMSSLGYSFMFSDYSYSADGSDYYSINDSEFADLIGFVFNKDDQMCEYWIYLKEGVNNTQVKNILGLQYGLSQKESTNDVFVYFDYYQRFRIEFTPAGSTVVFKDKYTFPFTPPVTMAWPDLGKGLGMTREQILAEFGQDGIIGDGYIGYLISNEYIKLYMFMFENQSEYVNYVAASVADGVDSTRIVDYLNSIYTVFPKGTLEDGSQYTWINAPDISSATIGIIYHVSSGLITYELI